MALHSSPDQNVENKVLFIENISTQSSSKITFDLASNPSLIPISNPAFNSGEKSSAAEVSKTFDDDVNITCSNDNIDGNIDFRLDAKEQIENLNCMKVSFTCSVSLALQAQTTGSTQRDNNLPEQDKDVISVNCENNTGLNHLHKVCNNSEKKENIVLPLNSETQDMSHDPSKLAVSNNEKSIVETYPDNKDHIHNTPVLVVELKPNIKTVDELQYFNLFHNAFRQMLIQAKRTLDHVASPITIQT